MGFGTATDVLVSVPNAELHQVVNGQQQLLMHGPFSVSISTPPNAPPEAGVVEAAVGDVHWPLGKHLPALKAADGIYSFALAHTKAEYLIVVLPKDTPADVLEAVHDVLHDVCAFSTVKQVDAAAEEADKLQGGKQAAALQAAEAAGAGPSAAAGAATAAAAAAPGAAGGGSAAVSGPPGAPGGPPLSHIQSGRYTLPSSGNKTADKVAAGLLTAGTAVAAAVGAAATATAGAIQNYAQKQMKDGPASQEHAKISPTFKRGLAVAGKIASSAAYVTAKLAEAVGHASYVTALAIAKSLPGHKKRHQGDEVTQEDRSVLHTVGAAGLVAFVDVYDSLEQAAKVVFYQSADASQQYIQYKYGPEAGDAAKQSVPVAKDMLDATINFSRLGARAFISRTAKSSAKVYFKSTMAGLHPDEQAAGRRLPVTTASAPAPAAAGTAGLPGTAAVASAAPAVGAAGGAGYPGLPATRVESSSSAYPPGSSAAAAAAAAGAARVGAAPAYPYPAAAK